MSVQVVRRPVTKIGNKARRRDTAATAVDRGSRS
jgi:hypothetical protein